MAKYALPTNLDTSYGDSGADASVKLHQQHHDALHGFLDRFETTYNPPRIINVMDYGAVFDGVTDDTAAIQAALDAAVNPFGGLSGNDLTATIVQMPPGRAYISQLKLTQNVWLRGHGASSTYLLHSSTTNYAIVLKTGDEVQTTVSDFGIIQSGTATAGGGIQINQTGGASITGDSIHTIRNLMIVETYQGIVLTGGSETRVTRVTIQRPKSTGVYATATDLFISDVTVAQAVAGGMDILGGNSRIWGCKVFGGGDGSANTFAFAFTGSGRHEVTCCEVQDFNGSGFSFSNSIGTCLLVDSCSGYAYHFVQDGDQGEIQGAALTKGGAYYAPLAALDLPPYALNNNKATITVGSVAFPMLSVDSSPGSDITLGKMGGTQAIAYAATITPDVWKGGRVFVGTLTGNITVNNPSTARGSRFVTGTRLAFYFTQDATAGRTVTWGAKYTLTGGALASTGAGTIRRIEFEYMGATLDVWREVGRN